MKKKSSANFTYKVGEYEGRRLLLIVDKDRGGRSVINDIENVIDDIAAHEGINPADYRIAYKDTNGDWDGWDHAGQFFYPLSQSVFNHLQNNILPNSKALAQ